ncbi:MAG TPA: hypothetical protein VLE70_20265 [Anaerolineae bacterium]|jgi:hypothetical protein|nr:hypothetical protein [Anaerolineae bacterium]
MASGEKQSWRWLNWSILLVFGGAVFLIGLISAGVFDPKPIGDPIDTLPLAPLEVNAGQVRLNWLALSVPDTDHSLRLEAALIEGEVDSAYGLVIGDESENLLVAISPVGYVTILINSNLEERPIIPWRTWPHVAMGNSANELWLDIEGDELTAVRTNRELLWQGSLSVPGKGIGLWVESYGGPAKIDFSSLELFAAEPNT